MSITEAESVLLEALWRSGPLTPYRLIAEVKAERPWGEATIKTLLARLKQKQAIRSERAEGVLLYRPLIAREAHIATEVTALVDRLFAGDEAALAAWLAARRTPPAP